ncbi:MAG: dihydropteroate synthase [Verrucomicrobiota bacterium]|nr:dihydropteroate synthase [Verrucomicrobiota bacterium]
MSGTKAANAPVTTGIARWRCGKREFDLAERPLIMGVLNATPDSFSDGGRFPDTASAVARGLALAEQGADILDIGGESTRPGADAVDEAEELRRVIPVIRAMRERSDIPISVDTTKAAVAAEAVRAGAEIINDVSALTDDSAMAGVAKESGAGVVLTHRKGAPRAMQADPRYDDVVREVRDYLCGRVEALVAFGLERERLAVDPGIGFGKTVDHNLELLAHLDALGACGRPVVVGLSRKSFLGKLTGRNVDERLASGLSALVFCALNGARVARVHDVKESRDAVRVATALRRKQTDVGGYFIPRD